MAQAPLISVCIATARRPRQLEDCLDSLRKQIDPPPHEILISGAAGLDRGGPVGPGEPVIRFIDRGVLRPPAARNELVKISRGPWLLFLDDDVETHPHLLNRLARLIGAHPEVGVLGGPNETPPNSPPFERIQGAVLASLVGAGPVRRRYGRHRPGPADERFFILCNLAVRRSVIRPFEDNLVCAEENELLNGLKRSGVKMHYDPRLVVFHRRRPNIRTFFKQMFKYGLGRGQVLARDPSATRPAHLAPSALLVLQPLAILLAVTNPWLWIAPVIYVMAVMANSAWIGVSLRSPPSIPTAALMIVLLHVAYGSGVFMGTTQPGRRRRDAERTSRAKTHQQK